LVADGKGAPLLMKTADDERAYTIVTDGDAHYACLGVPLA
jgi:hypothetical protein